MFDRGKLVDLHRSSGLFPTSESDGNQHLLGAVRIGRLLKRVKEISWEEVVLKASHGKSPKKKE